MENIEYLNTKSYLEQKALDLANALSHIDEQLDNMYKINLYLLRKYKDDLIKEFDIEETQFSEEQIKALQTIFNIEYNPQNEAIKLHQISEAILKQMKEEMPKPWYCYGFGEIK